MSDSLTLLKKDQVKLYWNLIFEGVNFEPEDIVCLRGIGEKGTKNESFKQDFFFQPALQDGAEICAYFCEKNSADYVASFILPCTLKEARGTSANVKEFTCVLVDLDSGNTTQKLDYLKEHVGAPSIVVASGGKVKEIGTPKMHVYYLLDRPTSDVASIVSMRDDLARKVGGDPQFGLGVDSNPYGRAHQPVRIAGSVHSKNEVLNSCEIIEVSGKRFSFETLRESIILMPHAPFVEVKIEERDGYVAPMFAQEKRDIDCTLVSKVYEGGEDVTRWSEFSRAAGHHVRQVREGRMDLEEAYERTLDWVAANMIPPWSDERCRTEFHGILNQDRSKNGAMPKKADAIITQENPEGIFGWAAYNWAIHPKPEHKFLVDKLIIQGEPHLFVAEGGAGKTGLILDLSMKIAAWEPECHLEWCGNKIVGGGTSVVILNEDSMREIHIRLLDIDKENLIKKAGKKLIVLPMTVLGGGFPLVERDPRSGSAVSHRRWIQWLNELRRIPDLVSVSIDTFNSVSHGDENKADVISETMREALRVCNELGAALIMAHHLRKTTNPIKNLAELTAEIRGSGAITSSFRNVFGMYHKNDYARRMLAMGLEPKRGALFGFGICKANINGLDQREKTLLRNEFGILIDVTAKDEYAHVDPEEREAWLLKAIEVAASKGHPFKRSVGTTGGLSKRRSELPKILKKIGPGELEVLIETLLQEGRIFLCSKGETASKDLLDVKEGGFASEEWGEVQMSSGAFIPPKWEEEFEYLSNRGCVVRKRNEEEMF